MDCFSNISHVRAGNIESTLKSMMNLKNKKVTVLGLARSGVAAANLLFERGAQVLVSDIKPKENLGNFINQLVSKDIVISENGDQIQDIKNADLVILSPGIPSDIPAVLEARKRNISVISEIELAYRLCKAPMIAITGSNGKTTTTSWVGEILKATWKGPVAVAGNIGFPLSTAVKDITSKGIVVAEISSFQLETIETFSPHIASILNITPNHLDRYPEMDSYANAKLRIFEFQKESDFAVINKDDIESSKRIKELKSNKIFFSVKNEVEQGAMIKDKSIVFRNSNKDDVICDFRDLILPGEHNLENALAAVAMVYCCGIRPDKMKEPLISFRGVEHRLEFVRELNGVKYINDSKATTVAAVMTALKAVSPPVILIAGGKDKGSDYTPLVELAKNKVKQLILIGQAKEKIRKSLNGSVPISEASSMEEAVNQARKISRQGDSILLSPACSSYDMFTDFEERGRVFKSAVGELK